MLMEVQELRKHYRTNVSLLYKAEGLFKALDGVEFSLNENEVVGLVGESGCGKSTLSRQLVGLEGITAGKVLFHGNNIQELKGRKLKAFRKDCQIIFQDTMSSLNPSLRIRNILYEPLDNHFRLRKKEKDDKIGGMLERVRLDKNILDRFPQTLSGGERQRVNICRALLLEPKLLICDEIVSSLDVSVQACILNLLKELKAGFKMSVIFISHDIDVVRFLCDSIMVMEKGRIIEVIDNTDKHYKVKHEYTKRLFDSLPVDHPDKRAI